MRFTAIIRPKQRRDVTTIYPKVLAINITNNGKVFRDHLWLEEIPEFKQLRNKGGNYYKITFDAEIVNYRNHLTKEEKYTLKNIKNVQLLR